MRLIPDGALYDIAAGHKRAPNGLTKYSNPISPLEGFFKLDFNAMDAWFEEDEEIFVHPKDPYKVGKPHCSTTAFMALPFLGSHIHMLIFPVHSSASTSFSPHDTFASKSMA